MHFFILNLFIAIEKNMRARLYYAVSVCERVAGGHFVSRVDKMAASPRAQKCAFAQQKENIYV